ncbi:GAF and ANTAR domain-containing protein [Microbispora tritici]|uniref:GAF and ANTAR domain-containing protein n=2 Tax=Microbispora TaxID=2005 RepID=A0ABY3M2U5_9ACTN|nr:GAF and ANTAR domain-containing protein [Microbispora fusca]TYB64712.1 GAF and ANTAR domain-containing protein [Microbispora tritici]
MTSVQLGKYELQRGHPRSPFWEAVVTRERQLTDAFAELTDTLVGDFDVVDMLHQLTMRCVRLLDVDAAGLLLADRQGRLRPMAASTEQARMLKLLQLQDVDGPGLDCYRTGGPVTCADLVAEGGRWPHFAAAAQLAGFVAVQALPMRHRDRIIGALTLLRTAAGRLTTDELHIGQALANVATISILHHRGLEQHEAAEEQLQTALNSRTLIEQATGVLAERHHSDMGDAFDSLCVYARTRNLRLSEAADAVIHGEHFAQPPADDHSR